MADLELQMNTPLPMCLPPETRAFIQITEMSAKLERLFAHDQQQVSLINRLTESNVRLEESGNLRAEKLEKLEELLIQHTKWKDRLGGIWVGVALTITTVASVAALIKTLIK